MDQKNQKATNESKRKLSKAELLRKDAFEHTKAELEADGYRMQSITFGVVYANLMAIVVSIPFILFIVTGYLWKNKSVSVSFRISSKSLPGGLFMMGAFLALLLILLVLHELIHGITWAIFAPGHWKAISFGFIAQYLTPYCTCRDALKKSAYIAGTFMPTLILGIIPGVAAIFTGSGWLLWTGIIMIFSGGGDVTLILKLLRFKTDAQEILIYDHPYMIGSVIFTR